MEYQDCKFFEVSCHIDNTQVAMQEVWQWFLGILVDMLVAILDAIPVPAFLEDVSFSVPSGVLWFAQALELDFGFAVIMSALVARFILRRIPGIG